MFNAVSIRPMLKPAEAAQLLGISRDMLYYRIKTGEIPAFRFGTKLLRLNPDVIDALKAEKEVVNGR